jgi:hypothetical protein
VDLVLNYSSFNLFFNKEIIKKRIDLVKEAFKGYLMTQDHVKESIAKRIF